MNVGTNQQISSSFVDLTRFVYGAPRSQNGQFAYSSLFDPGKFLTDLFFTSPVITQEHPDPSYFIELGALAILKDSLMPNPLDAGSLNTPNDLTQLILSRYWPSNLPPMVAPAAAPLSAQPTNPVGLLLNILA